VARACISITNVSDHLKRPKESVAPSDSYAEGAAVTSGSVFAGRELLIANAFLFGVVFCGTTGYMLIEGWPFQDSLYMTFLTLTTIGFSEVHELSGAGRIFTIFVGLIGIGSVAFVATRTAQILLNTRAFRHRTVMKMVQSTSDHYILAGYGRIRSRIAQDLQRHDVPFVIIESNTDKYETLLKSNMLFIQGNTEDEEVLLKAGI